MINKHLHFRSDIGRKKFEHQKGEVNCPFCSRDQLATIIDTAGSILLVENKFPTIEHTYQTVLIETDQCGEDISSYSASHMHKLITFGINHWFSMLESDRFASVLFYKNHGPLSGGSVDHAHMQIVGLQDVDYQQLICEESFDGVEIYREGNCVVNMSTKPNASAAEFNVITDQRNDRFLATHIQKLVRYVTSYCNSYNLFFYQWNGGIVCKVVPRYVTSPFLIGFSISQVTNSVEQVVEKVKSGYYK
ncbi:DUF4931 domain-containing protein [Vibrio sp. RC27]